MAVSTRSTSAIVSVASRTTACHVTHLSSCRFNFMNILLESVCNLGRVLFALSIGASVATCISTMANLAGRLVCRCLVLQTLFGRSLRRSTTVDLRIFCGMIRSMMTARAHPFLFTIACVATVTSAALVEVLLVASTRTRVSRSAPSPILIPNATIFWRRCVMMASTVTLRSTSHMWCLR